MTMLNEVPGNSGRVVDYYKIKCIKWEEFNYTSHERNIITVIQRD